LAILAISITVRAGDNFHSSDKGANAGFFSVNPPDCSCVDETSGCTFTDVIVVATNGKNQSPPGKGSQFSEAFVSISQFDCMAEQLFISCAVSLADSDFQVSQQLRSAMLSAKLPCFNMSGDPVDVDVDLNWTGNGDLSRSNSHFHSSSPGCAINGRFNGTSRQAEGTGTVYVDTTNFTPDPSDFAEIFSAKGGTLVIGCE
jgi:hypothetical protein